MSTLVPRRHTCRGCGARATREVAVSINGGRRPDLRAALLAGTFQRGTCEACGAPWRIEHPFVYLDFGRREWIACWPRRREAEWRSLENEPVEHWRQAMVVHAPRVAREISGGFRIRAVFGLDACREKLLSFTHGLDDAWLEVLKLDLQRRGTLRFHPAHRLRLRAVEGETLVLDVMGSARTLAVPRRELGARAVDALEWCEALAALSRGPYVDVGRIMIGGV